MSLKTTTPAVPTVYCYFCIHSNKLCLCLLSVLYHDRTEQRTAQPAPGKLSAITSLAVCAGSLWIGTGTGVLLRLPVKTVLDTDSLQMALGSPACSYDWACVAQWCHWSAVRCLQVIRCNTSPEEGKVIELHCVHEMALLLASKCCRAPKNGLHR